MGFCASAHKGVIGPHSVVQSFLMFPSGFLHLPCVSIAVIIAVFSDFKVLPQVLSSKKYCSSPLISPRAATLFLHSCLTFQVPLFCSGFLGYWLPSVHSLSVVSSCVPRRTCCCSALSQPPGAITFGDTAHRPRVIFPCLLLLVVFGCRFSGNTLGFSRLASACSQVSCCDF